jgi:hypothetical protein
MGSLNIIGLSTSKLSIGFLSAQITPVGGIILFLLIIIAGFLIFKYSKNLHEYNEDRTIGTNQGIAKKKIVN